jgi:ubiquinol-cytochrome c reductase cytochrome c subunit
MVFIGTNAPDLTDKTPAVIAGAIRWGPGPMPPFPESLLDNQQLASIVDYVSYVQHPPHPGGNALGWYGPIPEGFVAWIIVAALIGATIWIEKGGKG